MTMCPTLFTELNEPMDVKKYCETEKRKETFKYSFCYQLKYRIRYTSRPGNVQIKDLYERRLSVCPLRFLYLGLLFNLSLFWAIFDVDLVFYFYWSK